MKIGAYRSDFCPKSEKKAFIGFPQLALVHIQQYASRYYKKSMRDDRDYFMGNQRLER